MTTFASPGSFWSALSQVYVGTNDGTLHTFGFLDERRVNAESLTPESLIPDR